MSLIKGIHHVSMTCCNEQEYQRVVTFYRDVLKMPVARTWEKGIMFDTGSGVIEVFTDGDMPLEKGVIRHFALATEDVDACVKAVSEAGYEVFIKPKDILIPADAVLKAKIAFCKGPLGEEIEFFQEK